MKLKVVFVIPVEFSSGCLSQMMFQLSWLDNVYKRRWTEDETIKKKKVLQLFGIKIESLFN